MFLRKQMSKAILFSLLVITVALLGGCGRQTAGPDKTPTPSEQPRQQIKPLPEKRAEIAGVQVTTGGGSVRDGVINLARFTVPGGTFNYTPGTLASPDGRWIAFSATDCGTQGLWAMALDGSGGSLLARVGEKEHEAGTLLLELLGWTGDNRVVFTRQGTQPDGPHKGERGISLMTAQPDGGEPQEVCWLPVPNGMVHQVKLLPDKESVFVHLTGALWRINIINGLSTLIKDGLPIYDGLFIPRLSPDGGYYVYELYEPRQRGIYILDTESGEEKALAPSGATWNFYPRISPDGRHVVYYAAPLKTGKTGPGIEDYDLIPMEDGPASVAAGAELVTAGGRKVAGLAVQSEKIGDIAWAANGKSLAFVSGRIIKERSTGGALDFPQIEWRSLWVADLGGHTSKLATLPAGTAGNIQLLRVGPGGREVLYQVFGEENTLWLAREGREPVQVMPQTGWDATYPVPVYGEDVFLSRRVGEQDY